MGKRKLKRDERMITIAVSSADMSGSDWRLPARFLALP